MTLTDKETKTARIELRVSPQEKQVLEQAAIAEHIHVTAFIKRVALPAAEKAVVAAKRIQLSVEDAEKMLVLLEQSPTPTPALLAAAHAKYSP
jgi:uncharacterized protein (DUF1778 family)